MSSWIDMPLTRDLLVLAVVIVSVIAVFVVRRLLPPHALKENNDFVGFAYSFVGVVYGVYLAFAAVIVWEHFDNTASIEDGKGVRPLTTTCDGRP